MRGSGRGGVGGGGLGCFFLLLGVDYHSASFVYKKPVSRLTFVDLFASILAVEP